MSVINKEDIIGYSFDGKIFCTECVDAEEAKNALENEILTRKEVEENETAFFCDTCKEPIA